MSTLISTIGKVLSSRAAARELPSGPSQAGSEGDGEMTRSVIDELSGRIERLEEERDFYKDLLDAPAGRPEISPPEDDASDAVGGS